MKDLTDLSVLLAVPLVAILGSLRAQTKISTVPHEYHTMEGYSLSRLPFQDSNLRLQIYIGARHVGLKRPTVITHIGFRAEGHYDFQYSAKTLHWTLAMGETKTSFKALSKTFAKNTTGTMVTLFQGKIRLPARKNTTPPKLGTPLLMLKTTRPFAYMGGNLLIEILAQDPSGKNQQSAYSCDLARSFGPGATLFGHIGKGCPFGRNNYFTVSLGNVRPGGSLRDVLRNASVAKGTALMAFGTQIRRWGKVALPLDLGPAGAPGCYLWTDILFVVSAPVAARTVTLTVPIPNQRALTGQIINSQWLVVDPASNKLGLTTAPLIQRMISATGSYNLDTAQVFWSGNGNPSTQKTASGILKRQSPILLLGHY